MATFKEADNATLTVANTYLCSSLCPCKPPTDSYVVALFASNATRYQTSATGVENVQACPDLAKDFSETEQTQFKMMAKFEEMFKCSGFCTVTKLYLYSNINNGMPEGPCSAQLGNVIRKLSSTIGAVSIVIALILLFNSIMSCCYMCSRDELKSKINN